MVLCMLFSYALKAQSIVILDHNLLQPIEGVFIYKQNNNSIISTSNVKGEATLSGVSKNELLIFRHPNYAETFNSLDEIEKNNGSVLMKENVNSIEEIVVSASKFEEKRKDVAQKIQVVRSSELQEMNQTSTADVMASTGNVMVQKSQLGGGSPIIRGFETNKVLIVIDGVRMNNAIYRGGHLQNILTLDNSIMDRVEVVFYNKESDPITR